MLLRIWAFGNHKEKSDHKDDVRLEDRNIPENSHQKLLKNVGTGRRSAFPFEMVPFQGDICLFSAK